MSQWGNMAEALGLVAMLEGVANDVQALVEKNKAPGGRVALGGAKRASSAAADDDVAGKD